MRYLQQDKRHGFRDSARAQQRWPPWMTSGCAQQRLPSGTMLAAGAVMMMLAAWAVRSGKADDLRGKIEARRVQPMA